jgi:hypothetical protein
MLRPSPTLARKDFGSALDRHDTAFLLRASEEQTFSHYKTFVAVSNFEQTNAQ